MNIIPQPSSLPPGFRFHPTDEELVLHYLRRKVASAPLPVSIIAEVDIYKFNPWDLPRRPPRGVKTNWIMHEYRLTESSAYRPVRAKDSSMRLDNWVLCRIYEKSSAVNPAIPSVAAVASVKQDQEQEYNYGDHQQPMNSGLQLKDVVIASSNGSLVPQKSTSFSSLIDAMDYVTITGALFDTNQSSSSSSRFLQISSSSLYDDEGNNYPNINFEEPLIQGISDDYVGLGMFTAENSNPKSEYTSSWPMCQQRDSMGQSEILPQQLDSMGQSEILPQQMNSFSFNHSLLNQQLLPSPNFCDVYCEGEEMNGHDELEEVGRDNNEQEEMQQDDDQEEIQEDDEEEEMQQEEEQEKIEQNEKQEEMQEDEVQE
ncbi:hypothetical protein MLD38_030926 [Melastoma candidum]|uniref:Uncharacterized protein n=1 Tax=Melastoma candidum TaxID=119954 RepID=A0ACB9MPE5_9MYRT|nr:hypothetical protein MLD38_030926 [Melastoma candidum]